MRSQFWTIAEATGVWGAVIVALGGEWLKSLFIKPKLKVVVPWKREAAHKTAGENDYKAEIPVYYFRLGVVNKGSAAARDVQVYARAVFFRDSVGNWGVDDRFFPQWLTWVTLRNIGLGLVMPIISKGSPRAFDLMHVLDPNDRKDCIKNLEQDDEAPPDKTLLSLDVPVRFKRKAHLFGPGHYAMMVEVSAANAEPENFFVVINNSGAWYDDEETMLSSGVRVEQVVPIGSVADLKTQGAAILKKL